MSGSQFGTSNEQFIRVDRPDDPIYRIYPLHYLEEVFARQELVLVSPDFWEDPVELFSLQIAVEWDDGEQYVQKIINSSLPAVHGQCWSENAESDTLLRAYSRVVKDKTSGRNTCRDDEGVRVRTTPRRLLEAISTQSHHAGCFVGRMEYLKSLGEIERRIGRAVDAFGLRAFRDPLRVAELLLIKRKEFAHEAEIRLIIVDDGLATPRSIHRVQVDPNTLFDEIQVDPRLRTFERIEREDVIRNRGFTGRFAQSELYRGRGLEVSLNRPPRD